MVEAGQTDEEGNSRIVTGPPEIMVYTLEDLFELTGTDLEEWAVQKHVVNFWGNSANPHTQVKAWLTRINPIALRPVIAPVEIDVKLPKATKPKKSGVKKALICNDPHFGFRRDLKTGRLLEFHDRRALDIALQIAQDEQPDIIIWVGDGLDNAQWSDHFVTSPDMFATTQPALIEFAWWLAQFRLACPNAEIYVIEGNHDARMPKQILKHNVAAWDIRAVGEESLPPAMSLPRLLGLHNLNIQWVGDYPNGRVWLRDDIAALHGTIARAKSGATVQASIVDMQYSQIFGHIHRSELATKTLRVRDGYRTVFAFASGCLCHMDGRVPAVKSEVNWQKGVGMIEYREEGLALPTAILIGNEDAIYKGKVYTARDRMKDLRRDTTWEF